MPPKPNRPVNPAARVQQRTQAAIQHTEDHDRGNYNRTLAPAPPRQPSDPSFTPIVVTGSEDGTLTGLWPAKVRYWTGYAGGTPINFADQPGVAACWAFPAPGGADLTNTGEYLGLFVGIHSDQKAVFEAVPVGGGADEWSATDDGILTTEAQTGAGRKQTGTGTDGNLPGWYTVVTPAEMAAATGAPTSWAGYQAEINTVSGTGTSVFSTAFRNESFSPSPLGITQNWVSLVLTNQTNGTAAVSIFHGTSGAGVVCSGVPGGSNTNGFAVMQGGTLYSGATATVSGLSFRGGLYISGSLSVSAGSVTGLATVATSGDYADLTNKPTSPGWARCTATGGTLSVLNSSGCSVAQNATGDYTFTFTNAPFSSGDWTATFTGSEQSGQAAVAGIKSFLFNTVRVQFRLTDGTAVDPDLFTAVGVW